MSIFGFSIEPSTGGDFLPIVKYDARAGRFFRIDSINTNGSFSREPVDITSSFKALFDFESIEVGWIDFATGGAPSFVMVPYPGNRLPDRPSPNHKNGLRFGLKLAKDCGGDAPVREMAGVSKVFLGGIENLYKEYEAGKDANPGKLPAVILTGTTPVKTGTGERSSTNYRPDFKIVGWAARPVDLKPRVVTAPNQATGFSNGNGATAPATGSQRAAPPVQQQRPAVAADDFG